MKTLSSNEIDQVCGAGRWQVVRGIAVWLAGSLAWEGTTRTVDSIESKTGSGGQMNSGRRSNMYN